MNNAEAKFCVTVAAEIERTAKTLMRDTEIDTSKTYYSGKNGTIEHHPSMPGSAPAVDTGTLRMSVTHSVENEDGHPVGYVGSLLDNPPYGAYLEFGTSKMKPRPWLSTAVIKCNSLSARRREVFSGRKSGDDKPKGIRPESAECLREP
jgi:hypothetical protein